MLSERSVDWCRAQASAHLVSAMDSLYKQLNSVVQHVAHTALRSRNAVPSRFHIDRVMQALNAKAALGGRQGAPTGHEYNNATSGAQTKHPEGATHEAKPAGVFCHLQSKQRCL